MSQSANPNYWTDFIVYFVTNIYYDISSQAQGHICFNCFPLEEFNMLDSDKTRDELTPNWGNCGADWLIQRLSQADLLTGVGEN